MQRSTLAAVLFCSLGLPAVAAAEEPFLTLSLDEALKKAGTEKKLVFVDFYATWCMPCKMLDATTFKDPKVAEFLKNKVLALRFDAEKERALSEKYHVRGFPTLLFLKPDGKIAEVIGGFVEPADFLRMADGALTGRDTLTRITEALQKSPEDALLHALASEALSARGEDAEARKHGLQVLNNPNLDLLGATVVPTIVGQLLQLSSETTSAPDSTDAALEKLFKAATEAVNARQASNTQLALYAALNELHEEGDKTLATYDKLLTSDAKPEYLQRVTTLWTSPLAAEKRYADIAKYVDIPKIVGQLFAKLPTSQPGNPADRSATDPDTVARYHVISTAMEYYKVLVALEKHPEADALAKQILTVDDSAPMYNALAWSAYEAGKVTETNLQQARKALELSGGKEVGIIDTLARILNQLGKKDEAVKLVKDALADAPAGFERNVLEQCLEDFKAAKDAKDAPDPK
jgi:thiol-disulfide isomerase/thioredoxin